LNNCNIGEGIKKTEGDGMRERLGEGQEVIYLQNPSEERVASNLEFYMKLARMRERDGCMQENLGKRKRDRGIIQYLLV